MQNRLQGYVKPCDKIFVESYAKVHDMSRSEIVEIAVHQFVQSIPQDIRIQILVRAKKTT